jgi:hypothetical protein
MRGIQGDLEFFAKKLAFFPQPKPEVETERRPLSILLGTPLYVALIQRDDERTH